MNSLKTFNYENFGQIRVIKKNAEPWFIGKDVAEILGYKNTRDALSTHVDEEDKNTVVIHDGNKGNPNQTIINESGLYSLILSSKLKTAKQFKRWITSEVIPDIRKYGTYMTPETIEEAILKPDTIIKIATALKEEQVKNKALEARNSELVVDKEIMQPKAEYFDELVDKNLLTNFRETAKQLEVKEKLFIKFLLDKKYVYRDKRGKLMPYAQYVGGELFKIKECFNDKTDWSGTQTLITPKGRETFRLLYLKSV